MRISQIPFITKRFWNIRKWNGCNHYNKYKVLSVLETATDKCKSVAGVLNQFIVAFLI
jgi:hypothetical protein